MYLEELHLHQYRNYQDQRLTLNRGVNIFMGENGQGKTNLLESIYYLATGGNFRGNKDLELIRWNDDYFRLEARLRRETSSRVFDLEIYADRGRSKQIKINGVKYRRTADLLGYLQVVLFSPEDLVIIKGGPSERRRYIDQEICQLDGKYYTLIQQYKKVLQQRNNLLKSIAYRKGGSDELSVWNEQLVNYGSPIIYRRLQFLKILVPIARRMQKGLTDDGEVFNVTYQSSLGPIGQLELADIAEVFRRVLAEKGGEELRRGVTLWGPHRDDLIFYLNGYELKTYGSQGQQRTGILSLKLAELETFRRHNGEYPLLLLDDVMSELDDRRRGYLLDIIRDNQIQTIITGANIELITKEIAQDDIFVIKEGKIIS